MAEQAGVEAMTCDDDDRCYCCHATGGRHECNCWNPILVGRDAEQAFGHLVVRDPERMRRETDEALMRIREIIRLERRGGRARG